MNELLHLFATFFKIGAFTFGGGYAMLPMIIHEVTKYGWLTEDTILSFIGIAETTPGPFAINMATFVGLSIASFPGALAATLGVALPSFIIILLIAAVFSEFCNKSYVKAALKGLRPAIVGLISAAALVTAKSIFYIPSPAGNKLPFISGSVDICALTILLIALFAAIKKTHTILIILLSASLGIALYSFF